MRACSAPIACNAILLKIGMHPTTVRTLGLQMKVEVALTMAELPVVNVIRRRFGQLRVPPVMTVTTRMVMEVVGSVIDHP